jgi:hypothetical protein
MLAIKTAGLSTTRAASRVVQDATLWRVVQEKPL